MTEITRDGDRLYAGDGPEACWAHVNDNPNWHRNHARNALALADEIERLQCDLAWVPDTLTFEQANLIIDALIRTAPPEVRAVTPLELRGRWPKIRRGILAAF